MKHLFVANPMFAELERQKRVALAKRNWTGGPLGARILLISVYTYLFYLIVTNPRSVEPIAMLYILLVILFLVMPATLHGAIAGDVEKRSLDLLLVAPVTPGQIIVGKYMRGLLLMFGVTLAICVPTFIVQVIHGDESQVLYWSDSYGTVGFLRALGVVLTTGAFLGALSLWISSRTRSNGAALLGIVGAVFALYVLTVVFATVSMVMSQEFGSYLLSAHPFVALSNTYLISSGPEAESHVALAWLSTIAHVVLALVLLTMARNNLDRISKGRM